MTWTVFTHQHGENETRDDAPGRGGYSTVLIEADPLTADAWWEATYETEPDRHVTNPRYESGRAWDIETFEDPDRARAVCGHKTLREGAIGIPSTRPFTWNEIRSRLDVRVVRRDELEDFDP